MTSEGVVMVGEALGNGQEYMTIWTGLFLLWTQMKRTFLILPGMSCTLHFAIDQDDLDGGGAPLLILCDKPDLPNAKDPSEIAELLKLTGLRRKWRAFGSSCTTGNGVHESFEWLTMTIRDEANPYVDSKTRDDDDTTAAEPVFSSTGDMLGIGYDPTVDGENQTLQHFSRIQQGTQCPFAKSALLWGGSPILDRNTIEDQAMINVAVLSEFVHQVKKGAPLDGFCIELADQMATTGNPRELGESVRRLLTVLSDNDPAGERLMAKRYIAKRGWRFRFGRVDLFLTVFAPCYPATSSRYAFGTGRAFVLLQPEVSFGRHALPSDTPKTNWDHPKTVRDWTRVAFRNAGRPYHIPSTTRYPPAEHIVKPINDDGSSIVRWWEPLFT